MFSGAFVCGVASAIMLFSGRKAADRVAAAAAELTVVFGLIGLLTGPLWGRKAWGVWWQQDVFRYRYMAGDQRALSDDARRGLAIFRGKGRVEDATPLASRLPS